MAVSMLRSKTELKGLDDIANQKSTSGFRPTATLALADLYWRDDLRLFDGLVFRSLPSDAGE